MKICYIGDYPPPYGGFSVEIKGLSDNFLKLNQDCRVLNIGENRQRPSPDYISVHGYPDFIYKFLSAGYKQYLLHLVTTGHSRQSWQVATLLALSGKLNHRRSVLALGSGAMLSFLKAQKGWKRRWIRWVLKSCGMVIVKTEDAFNLIRSYGVPEERMRLTPAYSGDLNPDPKLLSPQIRSFYDLHEPIIVSSVSFLPEYGIEFTLDAIQSLLNEYPKIGLVFAGAETGRESILDEIQKRQLPDHVLLAGPQSRPAYLSLVQMGTVFLRATTFDGDASSIREALGLKVPVVASRTDFRPEGTVLFKIGQLDDLLQKLRLVLENPGNFIGNGDMKSALQVGDFNIWLKIYREVLLLSGMKQEQLPEVIQNVMD